MEDSLRAEFNALPELEELYEILDILGDRADVRKIAEVKHRHLSFPIIAIVLGSKDPNVPVLGLFGGVHGLERIGTKVILSYLRTLGELLRWDKSTSNLLQESKLIFMPLVNPIGMYLQRRSNGNGVDLMRNAPVRAENIPGLFLFAGHRLSPLIPWYQGEEGAAMEVEAQALCNFIRKETFTSPVAITLDVHSGYGTRDRIWFPYARTKAPFPNIAQVFALKSLLDKTYPNHVYCIEPQSHQYCAHGDLWDYLYDEYHSAEKGGIFLPLSLELGSWLWVKKNMRQAFSLLGVFNPLAPHRLQRTLRRHMTLFDFLHRLVLSPDVWARLTDKEEGNMRHLAKDLWYGSQ